MAGRQMSALAHLGASDNSPKQKPILSRHQNVIAATTGGDPYPANSSASRTSKAPGERMAERRQKPKETPSPVPGSSGTRHETESMMIDHNPSDSDRDRSSSPNRSDSSVDASSSHILGETPQEPFSFNFGTPPNEPAQPEPPVSGFTVSSTAVNATYISPLHFHPPINPPMHNPEDTPSTSSSSPPASSATPTNALQTVQTYLTNQAQAIQLHLTAALPGLIQGEVRTQCAQIAQEISAQISLIREEVIRPTEDQDDPMLPSNEEIAKGGSRGRGERSVRCSRDKGKGGRFAQERDNEAAETHGHHHQSQQPDNGDEADNEEEGNENENDEEELSVGSGKYMKQMQALREPLRAFLLQKGVIVREELGLPVLPLPPCAPAIHVKQFTEKHTRTGPDACNIQYNWQRPLGKCPWNRQATLLLAKEYLELYKGGKIKLNHHILPYNPKADLKTIQKTIRQRLRRTQTYWKDLNLPNSITPPYGDDDGNNDTAAVPCTIQERAEGKVTLTRRRTRGTKSLKDRKANIEKYLNGDLKEELLNMLQRLHSAGMNYDITDSESSERAVQSCIHWWLSADVISILQELDNLGKRAKASRLVSKKGNRTLPRTKNIKIIYDSTKTTSLPKNWYRHEWYESLCPFEQGDLNCAEPEILPSIHNLRAAIEYLLTRGSSQ